MTRGARKWALLMAAAGVGLAGLGEPARAEPDVDPMADAALEGFLERLSLNTLLAEQLEGRLAATAKGDRQPVAEKLAKVYAVLLAASKTPLEAAEWEKRSRELLAQVPDADSFELRIHLNRAIYLRAEEIGERHRIRLAKDEEVAQAQASLRSIAQQSRELGSKLHGRVLQLERLEATLEGTDALDQELSDARRLRSLAFYYAGWASVYSAYLSGSEAPAVEALKDFGWLLNSAGNKLPSVDRVAPEMMKYEHITRAALGCAMAASMRGNDVEALRWLELIDLSPDTPTGVREQLLARRISVYGAAKRWADLERTLRIARRVQRDGKPTETAPLTPLIARLAAVIALEADKRIAPQQIEGVAKTALGDLVSRKEAAQVLDLVRRYGTAPLGETGFIVHYVRGLQQYELARASHPGADADPPEPASAETANLYRSAAGLLEAAMSSPDEDEFGIERSRALVTLGRALVNSGSVREGAAKFADAWSAAGKGAEGEEALWLAIAATDRAARSEPKLESDAARRAELVTMYLQAYPDSPRAPRLVLLQASAGELSDDDALKVLSGVAKGTPTYEAARRQMARILYTKCRGAAPSDRDFAATRFLAVAEEVLGFDVKAASAGSGPSGANADSRAAGERVVARCRQILDAILMQQSPDVDRAESALVTLTSIAQQNGVSLTTHEPELAFRRVQIALAKSEPAEAMSHADALAARPDRGGTFGPLADYITFRSLAGTWGTQVPQERSIETGQMLVRLGVRLIDQAGASDKRVNDQKTLAIYSTTADAALSVFERAGDPSMRDLALRLDGIVLGVQPRFASALKRIARASESAGDTARARAARTTLAEAAQSGTPEWFEARYELAALLSRSDPGAARRLIDQQRALYPEFGPEPWGERFRALDTSVPQIVPEAAPQSPTAPPTASPKEGQP